MATINRRLYHAREQMATNQQIATSMPLFLLPNSSLTPAPSLRSSSFRCPSVPHQRVPPLFHRQVMCADSTRRVACVVQYNGAAFHGWERKPDVRTVQQEIEAAISALCRQHVRVQAASKTDAGAHAIGQVVHFDPPVQFDNARSWISSINRRLPSDVLVTDAVSVPHCFHARKSASWRRYRYTIFTDAQPSVFLAPFTWHYYQKTLDVELMHAAAATLQSDTARDLSAFRKSRSAASHTQIAVHAISVRRNECDERFVEVEVCANWFVYGMMRLVVAALVQVGCGALSVEQFTAIVDSGGRDGVKFSAPANGLCLVQVGYGDGNSPFGCASQSSNFLFRK